MTRHEELRGIIKDHIECLESKPLNEEYHLSRIIECNRKLKLPDYKINWIFSIINRMLKI